MDDLAEAKEKIFPGNYAGTGFLLSSRGYVATSYHVVKDADSVVIENEKFGRLKTVVVHSDPINDISILKIDKALGFKSLPFTIVEDEASLAEEVYTLGYPREDVVFGEGSVSALTGYLQNPNAYQISIPVNPGNSGGPLLNSKGDLIGMISGLQTQTSGAAFAIKSSILLNSVVDPALDSLAVPLTLPKLNTIKNVGRIQQVKQWRDFVFVVRVYKN
jgi:S1-C subfamily serine protease